MATLNYRPEIDGLRAVAVIPVILFHAGFNIFSGGFLGVDIFFVISGFLITAIILKEIESKSFSIINFYERRVRRISPALFLIILASIPFAWQLMTPFEMESFGQSILATLAFISNIFFWREINYFAPASDLYPMLHTWSLGIEEQFYIFFPIIIVLLAKLQKRIIFPAIITGLVLSLCLAEWASIHYTQASFFLLPTRAWELLAGAATFMISRQINLKGDIVRNFISFIAIALIMGSYVFIDDTMRLPGFLSIYAILGTCLILLFTTQETIVGRILSFKPVVLTGAMSYSLYLWHQPVFSFAKLYFWTAMTTEIYIFLICLVFVLSFLSWYLVEAPFRNKKRFTRKKIFSLFTLFVLLIGSFGAGAWATNGFPNRTEETKILEGIEGRLDINYGLSPVCDENIGNEISCRYGSSKSEMVLWGDSYAMHLAYGLKNSSTNNNFVQFTKSVCTPVLEISPLRHPKYNEAWAKTCISFNKSATKFIQETNNIKYIAISSPFSTLLSNTTKAYLPDSTIINGNQSNLADRMKNTLDQISQSGKTLVIISPPPRDGRDVAQCHVRMLMKGKDNSVCNIKRSDYEQFSENVIAFLKEIEKEYPVIWLSDYLCDEETCYTYIDNTFIYRDSGHLSKEGSTYLGKKMDIYNLIKSQ